MSRQPPLETLFFDAGGVLVVPNWPRVSDTLARYGVAAPVDARVVQRVVVERPSTRMHVTLDDSPSAARVVCPQPPATSSELSR